MMTLVLAHSEPILSQLENLISGVMRLEPEAFAAIANLSGSLWASMAIVLLAGLSQTLGQSFMLFVNRVRPLRFVLSIIVAAIIFLFNYNFWVASTWLVAQQIYHVKLALLEVIRTLGFCYAPLLLGFLMVLPYFGMPILVVLSIWTLMAIVTGLEVITNLGVWPAFACCLGGWLMLQLSQRVLGKAIAQIIDKLVDWAAGVDLITEPDYLEQMLYSGLPIPPETRNIPDLLGEAKSD